MIKIDCQKYANEILDLVKDRVKDSKTNRKLIIFTAGYDPASEAYVRGKLKDCSKCGVEAVNIRVNDQRDLLRQIEIMNNLDRAGGIIVQLPLPKGFDEFEAVNRVRIDKDVDGFKQGSPFLPCTPEGIMFVLKKELGYLAGKSVLLIGKGKLVGRPLIDLLLDQGCTLTIAHSKTKNLESELKRHHDIVITAVGKPKLVNLYATNADVVIDAGISRGEDGKLCGDCYNFDPDDGHDMKVTTVPNGIGLLTRAMLMKHMGEVH